MTLWQRIVSRVKPYSPLKFKTKRVEKEWLRIPKKNGKLRALVLHTAWLLDEYCSSECLITSIHRTKEEQLSFFKRKLTRIKTSPHMYWRAADIRVNHIEDSKAIEKVADHINKAWKRSDSKPTALIHGDGSNKHLHLQLQAAEVS